MYRQTPGGYDMNNAMQWYAYHHGAYHPTAPQLMMRPSAGPYMQQPGHYVQQPGPYVQQPGHYVQQQVPTNMDQSVHHGYIQNPQNHHQQGYSQYGLYGNNYHPHVAPVPEFPSPPMTINGSPPSTSDCGDPVQRQTLLPKAATGDGQPATESRYVAPPNEEAAVAADGYMTGQAGEAISRQAPVQNGEVQYALAEEQRYAVPEVPQHEQCPTSLPLQNAQISHVPSESQYSRPANADYAVPVCRNLSPATTTSGSSMSSPGCSGEGPSVAGAAENTLLHRPKPNRGPYEWLKKKRSGGSNRGKTRTRDKYRVVYSDFQRMELEKEYLFSNKYISEDRKAEFSNMLGLSSRQVKIWFQNRRAKERRQRRNEKLQQALAQNGLHQNTPQPVMTELNMYSAPYQLMPYAPPYPMMLNMSEPGPSSQQ